MKESDFIERNIKSWHRLESLIAADHSDPDELQSLFVKVSGDLAYARTFYPNRIVKNYLNDLLKSVFDKLPKEKNQSLSKLLVRYYRHTLPTQIITHRWVFLFTFSLFVLAVLIGVFSNIEDIEFLRSILGNAYVDMTETNIASGDPMAVYKQQEETTMFLSISIHNIQVSFFAFVIGLLGSIGTVYIILYNGIMLGAFQAFFYQKGLFLTSFLTIWIHGTIEISSIIVAGTAGIIMGNGLLFPKSYSRKESIKKSSSDGLVVILSIIPLLIISGFLEGFITRLTEMPTFVKVGIILFSLLFILSIYVIYPIIYYRKGLYQKPTDEDSIMAYANKVENVNPPSLVEKSLSAFAVSIVSIIKSFTFPLWITITLILYFFISGSFISSDAMDYAPSIYDFILNPVGILVTTLLLSYFVVTSSLIYNSEDVTHKSIYGLMRKKLLMTMVLVMFLWVFILVSYFNFYVAMVLLPVAGISHSVLNLSSEHYQDARDIFSDLKKSYNFYFKLFPSIIGLVIVMLLITMLNNAQVLSVFYEFLEAHHIIDNIIIQRFFYKIVLQSIIFIPLMYFWMVLFSTHFDNIETQIEATDLKAKFDLFSTRQELV